MTMSKEATAPQTASATKDHDTQAAAMHLNLLLKRVLQQSRVHCPREPDAAKVLRGLADLVEREIDKVLGPHL